MATYYWVGGNGTWDASSTANWALTSGGLPGVAAPNNTDTVIFDSASGTGTCTTASGSACATATLNTSTLGLTLGANHTMSGTFTLTLGILSLGSSILTCNLFSSANSNTRVINFGTGNITLLGNAATIWTTGTQTGFSYTGTPTVNCTYSGSTGTRGITTATTANGGTEANAITFNISAGSDIITFSNQGVKNSLSFTGFSGTLTNTTHFVYGNLTISSGMTLPAGTSPITFAATSGTQQITTAGKTLDFPITKDGAGTVQLQDNLDIAARTFTLTAGTLDLGNNTLRAFVFSSTNSNIRSIAFNASGKIILSGLSGTIWNTNVATNFSYTGNSYVEFNYSGSVGTRTIAAGTLTEATSFNILITAGTDTIAGPSFARDLNFTGFSGTFSNGTRFIYGNLTYSTGMTVSAGTSVTTLAATSGTQQVTTNGKTLDFPITKDGAGTLQLQDNLTVGSTRTFTLTAGTLNLSNGNRTLSTGLFASANSLTRSITFGTGNITTTGSGNVWNTGTVTNFSYTGTPTVNISNNSATATSVTTGAMTEAQALNFNFTVGTYTLTDASSFYRSVNFTGFTGTWSNSVRTIYGNLTLVSGMTLTAGAVATVFSATSGTQQITTAGKTIDFPIAANANGGTRQFMDALTLGATRTFAVTRGTVVFLAGSTNTGGIFSFVGTSTSKITIRSSIPGTQYTLSQPSGTVNAAFTSIQDSNATGGASWNAYTDFENTDAGNNDGWNFSLSPPYSIAELPVTLRPFTQPRRF
jgi:hypothetical protein